MNPIRPTLLALLIVMLVAISAGFVRCIVASSEPLWLDELHTSWTVNGSFSDVIDRATDGNQQPIFFLLTKCSVFWLGHSEISLRLISLIAGLGTLLIASWFTWRWTGSGFASTAVALLIAIDPQFVFYASEARPYALIQWLSVIQVMLFFHAVWERWQVSNMNSVVVESSKKKLIGQGRNNHCYPYWGLTIVSVALIYTHVTTIWLLALESVFYGCLLVRNHQSKFRWKRFALTTVVVGVALIPVIFQTNAIMERKENWQSVSSLVRLWGDFWPTWVGLILLPAIYVVVARDIRSASVTEEPVETELKRHDVGIMSRSLFVFAWAIAPFLFVAGLEYFQVAPLALIRYTMVGAVAFPIFAGLCIGGLPTVWNRFVLAAVIVTVNVTQNPLFQTIFENGKIVQFRIEDWRTPIDIVNSDFTKSNQPVFLFANVIEDRAAYSNPDPRFQEYLLFPLKGLDPIGNIGRRVEAGPTLEFTHFNDDQIKSIENQGGAWIIVRTQTKTLVQEIVDEACTRIGDALHRHPSKIDISIIEQPNNPVFLISVGL